MLSASEADVEEMIGPYERIYSRCQCMDIAPDTFPARFPE
jgi:5-methylthioadenosine/S-adenosylhomocysteine deaminase